MRLIDADALIEKMKDCGFSTEQELMANAFCFAALKSERLAPTVGGWISVKDRMPEPPAQCLVYSDKARRPRGMETATYTNLGWMTAAYFPEITHWMPLPEPPKEGE